MLRWQLIVILTFLSSMLAGIIANGSEAKEQRLAVQRIEVQVVRETPVRVFVQVHGVVLNGCTHLGAIEQHRDAQVVTVTIATHPTAETCTMMARLVDETIRLDGRFTPGSYAVNVNGVVANFRI